MGTPLLNIGVTVAVFQRLGNTFKGKDGLMNFVIESAIIGAASLSIRELMPSTPVDLLEPIFKR